MMSPREVLLEHSLARIRGLLDHLVLDEDPECCLVGIATIVQSMIGDRAGIAPDPETEEPAE